MQKQQPQQKSPRLAIADGYNRLKAKPNDKSGARQRGASRQVPPQVLVQLITAAGQSSIISASCAEKGKGMEARPTVRLLAPLHLRWTLWQNKGK